MESSEDDAGAATNGSRRASAREKDVGGSEDGGASGDVSQEAAASEAGAASEIASMPEEVYDGDSVPSPSTHDHNTSTEALLDMIDEIVEGPGAPKRRPLSSDNANNDMNPNDHSNLEPGPSKSDSDAEATLSSVLSSAPPTQCENEPHKSLVDSQTPSSLSDIENRPHECLVDTESSVPPTRCENKPSERLSYCEISASCDNPPTRNESMVEIEAPSDSVLHEGSVYTEPPASHSKYDSIPQESLVDMEVLHSDSDNITHEPLVDLQTPASTSNSANLFQSTNNNSQIECTSHSDVNIADVDTISDQSSQASSSMPSEEAADSNIPQESVKMNLITVVSSESPPCNIPSSSIVETVQNVLDISDSQMSERTIKCVTSSDSRDNVTVESAESTSSDNSFSEGRIAISEATTRSPLRRRLVRPAPCDRRPDSTVSSTVDSQSIKVDTTELTSSESVAKDVSSSSDAVPPVYGNLKAEEIRNVSEISVCKAETSMSPLKKIKLVRHKVSPVTIHKDNTDDKPVLNAEPVVEQCQSTSSESLPSASLDPEPNSSKHISKKLECEVESEVKNKSVTSKSATPIIPESAPQSINECIEKKPQDCEDSADLNPCLENTSTCPERGSAYVSPCSTKASSSPECDKESDHQIKVPPIEINPVESNIPEIPTSEIKTDIMDQQSGTSSTCEVHQDLSDSIKHVPKLTIKLGNKQTEEMKSPIPKLTIKPIRHPTEKEDDKRDSNEQVPNVTKLNIKPIVKPAEKINDIHRKSSSSEISESESSENDESNSTSDQTSTSDQGAPDVVPKVTIKMGKPGTESEGKFYTEKNIPKLTIKGIQHAENDEQDSILKLVVSHSEDKQTEKIPKLTIKTVTLSESQPLSPKLTIKPLKSPDNTNKESTVDQVETLHKTKTSTESSPNIDVTENAHVPKITIKPIIKTDPENIKTPKKSSVVCDSPDYIPIVTKLNIKPILKPTDTAKSSDSLEETVPVVSKLNIKPILKPTIYEAVQKKEDNIPVISKLNIKPVLKPTDSAHSSNDPDIPVVSKLNIKPILKPIEIGDSESIGDNIPVVAKLNIKPVLKPAGSGETSEGMEDKVPVVSKLNIKPIMKPKDIEVDSSIDDVPKITKLNIKPLKNPEEKSLDTKDCDELNANKTEQNSIPVVTKLNIKPVVKPKEKESLKESENQSSETGNSSDDNNDNIPVVTKIHIKPILRPIKSEDNRPNICNEESIPIVTKLNIKPLLKPEESKSPSSPKKDNLRCTDSKSSSVPVVTKLNIKPVVRPEEPDQQKDKTDNEDTSPKNPPLVMKINKKAVSDISSNENLCIADKKVNNIDKNPDHICNNVSENVPSNSKLNIVTKPTESKPISLDSTEKVIMNCKPSITSHLPEMIKSQQCPPPVKEPISIRGELLKSKKACNLIPLKQSQDAIKSEHSQNVCSELREKSESIRVSLVETLSTQTPSKQTATENCSLLKKLLGLDNRLEDDVLNVNHSPVRKESSLPCSKESVDFEQLDKNKVKLETRFDNEVSKSPKQDKIIDMSSQLTIKLCPVQDITKQPTENLTKPLEINVSEKIANQSSGQDSPRIIIKINKTDHGSSAKIITEEMKRPETPKQNDTSENTLEIINDKQVQKNTVQINSRKKRNTDIAPNMAMGKRLRSSRIVENTKKSPVVKRNIGKRSSTNETTPPESKGSELSILETKRLKLGQILSNKSLTITPVPSKTQISPQPNMDPKQSGKTVNHALLNNENCSKNGNSKLHNILSNLQAKQAQALAFNDLKCSEKISITAELESNTSTRSSDVIEVAPIENSHLEVHTIISENSESRDFQIGSDEISQDPLEVDTSKTSSVVTADSPTILKPVELTPQPKKRGRPRKLPVSEGAKPLVLPVPALVERPQRSLRLSRDRPAILAKPRGRGRGRGARKAQPVPPPASDPVVETATKFFVEEQKPAEEIDPTSSRIKLPRMTEALDKMPAVCTTPLSSRRRSSAADLKLFVDAPELKVVLENTPMPKLEDIFVKSPETPSGRGSRGGRGRGRGRGAGRSPRGRGRGRGGGRGAMYMKETMGIYGRVCGPATTTVQLFEEETCMMDDNATPAKPSHLLDEDSQSSVKSSTNESSKMKKSKFADLFDSNKVWTAADVKEYMWPPPERPDVEHQVMMVQEQVAMFLGVKSFKRRYPELKRRTIGGEERDYVLSKGLVTEALCDLGITAVDASEVLDIMLSDYPHKYEEYRSHQRDRQRAEASSDDTTMETKPEVKVEKVEIKVEMKPLEPKPEPSKVDLEKSRQDMAAAAIASASEWNARLNALRRPACVDLQTMTVHRRRVAPARPPAVHVRPPAGFYPHALLPGQYQHWYRVYTPEQLRYFPLNTAVAAPPAPPSPAPSSSDSEPGWGSGSSSEDSASDRQPAKRKKLTKTKRSSQTEASSSSGALTGGAGVKEEPREGEELCRVCKLRLEANRKYTHERFLVCANCNAKLHPSCVELGADTIRKCREYAWQCAECKTCCACALPADDDKMLFCDLCDRGFHIYCVGLDKVPNGRWHCVECAICKSCGARDPNGPVVPGSTPSGSTTPMGSVTPAGGGEWHHQTRRGPGGHKMYSHSLCTPCARAYRIGRYCPLCDRSFIGPKGTMQLVICKLCDRQHHQDCVRQSVSNLNVLDYTCGECRRGGITSRAAAARLAPRTIATLFMAKRRFNKYAHRQYMKSRLQAKSSHASETSNDVPDDPTESCDVPDDPAESCDRAERPDDASDVSDAAPDDASDPLEGAGDPVPDEAAAAVQALRMDFGD